jgi:uncharacterized protein (DUF1501 family)
MIDRRVFLKSGALSLLSLGLTPGFVWRTAHARATRQNKTLVCIFQRGAVDGLSMLVPFGEPAYYGMRPRIAIAQPGARDGAALDLDGRFAFHPALAPFKGLYDRGLLAAVHAVGSPSATRSHFDAQYFMETAVPDVKSTRDGWLNRALAVSTKTDPEGHRFLRAVAMGDRLPVALKGDEPALAISDLESFMAGPPAGLDAFTALYDEDSGDSVLGASGREATEAIKLLREHDPRRYEPENEYPRSPFGRSLAEIAQLIKADIGLQIAFADVGGWDTHVNQGAAQGQLAQRLRDFSDSIAAFCADLGDRMEDVLVLTMSEFGRTARENGNAGTDHGHANCLFLIGGSVKGGTIYGNWPGLEPEQLYEGRDLALTTDFRDIFAEALASQLGIEALDRVFPGYQVDRAKFRGLIG